ncbi:hypothetical protein EVAR_11042_1 [Eumeta japonica]|uniref:115 kDa protein in type-1 retrotransposable element R1DM n=1 Tax=Eumeta variegata TaxID=151549 RepID=A0A4C1U3Y5_EUMVA|nr:hypothetical protein EVAR_11042_1 [Eumeta japonica]
MEPITTRRYNTNKADWTEFCLQLRNTLQKTEETKANPLVDSGTKRSKKDVLRKKRRIRTAPREKGQSKITLRPRRYTLRSRNSTDRKLERVARPRTRKAFLRELSEKAPGPDGLTADICIAAIESEMEVFLAIANKCLELAYFPTHWKTAHVVIIPKPGKRITPSRNPTGR